jgi:ribosomal protein L40E
MKTRPRTKFVHATGERRCPKCQAKLNNQVTRCKRCNATQTKPKKRLKRKIKFRAKSVAKKGNTR